MSNFQLKGLTSAEASERIAEGKGNRVKNDNRSSVKDIIFRNVFTYFNLLYLVIFVVLVLLGSYRNLLFIFVAISNTGLGIFQQLRAKKILDEMRILTDAKVETLRDGKIVELSKEDLAEGDVVRLKRGDQVPADGKVLEGYIETDESLLTGEFDPVKKNEGSELFSGSSVTSGMCYAELTCVGENIYARKIMAEGKAEKRIVGTVKKSLDKILRIISISAIPLTAAYFIKNAVIGKMDVRVTLLENTGALLGLIPAGLMLLTSVALSVSSVRLAKSGILFEEPYAIESLAKTDLLCLDKTGTLTEGKLHVESAESYTDDDLSYVIGNMMRAMREEAGTTSEALRKYFEEKDGLTIRELIPFSSDKKYSGVVFEEGTYYLGAAEYLMEQPDPKRYAKLSEISLKGNRVLSVVKEENGARTWIGAVILSDQIRTSLKPTLNALEERGVHFCVLSGDNPDTVSYIAGKAGISNAENRCDMSKERGRDYAELSAKYTVFGRVTPADKAGLIKEWKKAGKTVTMIGDGINDLPALRTSDCGIAMIDGAKATRQAADAVLMENDFGVLMNGIMEGKRVINNITLSASMYLVKTAFSMFFLTAILFLPLRYPFEPIQLSFISGFFVGFPTFILAAFAEDIKTKIEPFNPAVLKRVIPGASTVALGLSFIPFAGSALGFDAAGLALVSYLFTAWIYFLALCDVYAPLKTWKKFFLAGVLAAFLLASYVFRKLLGLELTALFAQKILPFAGILAAGAVIMFVIKRITVSVLSKRSEG